jgi:tetratricopeptide (TPR) repeat protein
MLDAVPRSAARKLAPATWFLAGLIIAAAAGLAVVYYRRPQPPAVSPQDRREQEQAAAHADLEALNSRIVDAVSADKSLTMLPSLWALVQKHPDSPAIRNALAMLLTHVGHLSEAYDQCRESLRLDNQQVEVFLDAGNLAWALGNLDQASKDFDSALRLDARNPRCLLRRADFLLTCPKAGAAAQKSDLARALVDLNTLLSTDRRQDYEQYGYQAWALMADVMARQNNPVALEKIDRALAETPAQEHRSGGKLGVYLRKKAALLCQFNRFEEALTALRALDTQDKLDPDVVEQMAVCQIMLGHPAAAAREYAAALAVSNLDNTPPDWRLLAGAARYSLKAGDKPAARDYVTTLQARNPAAPGLAELEKQLKD